MSDVYASSTGARAHAGVPFRGSGTCACSAYFSGASCEEGLCPAGMGLVANTSTNGQSCTRCSGVEYKATLGNSECAPCPPGASTDEDATGCICDAGRYTFMENGTLTCPQCPAGATTSSDGASCVCGAGTSFVEVDGRPTCPPRLYLTFVSGEESSWSLSDFTLWTENRRPPDLAQLW